MSIHGRPNDERGLFGISIGDVIGLATSIVPGGGLVKTGIGIAGGVIGSGSLAGTDNIIPGIDDAIDIFEDITGGRERGRTPAQIRRQRIARRATERAGNGACEDPRLEPTGPGGRCEFPGSPSSGVGELRKGRYGPAEEPMFVTRNVRFCLDGFILGDDSLCYKKGSISNKERMWPKGTPPLLTGGQVAAIRKADSAKKRVKSVAGKLGLLKPATRRAPRAHQHAVAAKGVVNV